MTKDKTVDKAEDEIANEQVIESVPVDKLIPHPKNPREGDIGAIVESIKTNGFYGYLIAQRSTQYVIVGNHRLKALQQLGAETVPVLWLDCTDDEATRILLADNRLSDLATYNDAVLAETLRELIESSDLAGTGYDGDFLDRLMSDVEKTMAESLEIDMDEVSKHLQHECPKCGFKFG